tara:strand:+ start:69 stop:575 length:507 start_codon:yes stop_codon:yes gene_type:complete
MKNYTPIEKTDQSDKISTNFWHGKVSQFTKDGKFITFTVSSHLDPNKEYNFRMVGKARAGFVTIFEHKNLKAKNLPWYLGKSTQNVQAWLGPKNSTEDHKGIWVNVLTKKGTAFHSIDKAILESLTVSDMHNSFPKMVDYDLWKNVNANTHADKAYKFNKNSKKLQHA